MAHDPKKAAFRRRHLLREAVTRCGVQEPCVTLKIKIYCQLFERTNSFIPLGSIPYPAGNRAPFPQRQFYLLSLPTQRFITKLILLCLDLFDANLCFARITEDTFLVDLDSEDPMLTNWAFLNDIVDLNPSTRAQQIDQNMLLLADMIEEDVLAGCKMPEEVEQGLLPLMRKDANEMLYLIANHPSLVPLDNRLDLSLRVHVELVDVLEKLYHNQYMKVLADLILPDDWRELVAAIEYLADFYSKSTYNPNETRKEMIALQVMRYLRNSSEHGMSKAVDKKKRRMNYTRVQVAQMLYAMTPLTLHSAMKALHAINRLQGLHIESLFGSPR